LNQPSRAASIMSTFPSCLKLTVPNVRIEKSGRLGIYGRLSKEAASADGAVSCLGD
jgi:hypothetical protein